MVIFDLDLALELGTRDPEMLVMLGSLELKPILVPVLVDSYLTLP